MRARTKVFFDGGWRPATGMETAVVVLGRTHITRDLGPGTSMEAEWLALIAALRIALEGGLKDFVLLGDSRSVVDQANGAVVCRGAGIAHHETFRALAGDGAPRVRHIKRSQNLAGIALAALHAR